MNLAILEFYNIDYRKGLERCLGDKEFYEEMLQGFLDDKSFSKAEAAFNTDDNEELFQAVHDLKSVCGNVGIDELYKPVCSIVEMLRNKEKLKRMLVEPEYRMMEAAYSKACEGIRKAIGTSPASV